ncbi:MAG: carboxypeptidase regulatory-like domain-containing protein [Chitinispirillaceae bacterium]|nr:carboxypeptidase regulatory-like domain-containing protein [Chitinispirillaceae bacterium]
MSKKLLTCAVSLIFSYSLSYATITNFIFPKDTIVSGDSCSYSYESSKDTVTNELWLELTGDTIFNETDDRLLFSFVMLDNNTIPSMNIMPDNNPISHKYQFGPEKIDLPKARFYLRLKDGEGSTSIKSFIVMDPIPKIRIEGTVSVPEGYSSKNIIVVAYTVGGGERIFQTLTDSVGKYTLNIDSTTVANYDSVVVQINKDISNIPLLVPIPSQVTISIKDGDVESVDFSLVKGSSFITGNVSSSYNNEPIPNVWVSVRDLKSNTYEYTLTDEAGNYLIPVADSGKYSVGIYSPNSPNGYMNPKERVVTIWESDTKIVNFSLVKCDTFFYVKIQKDGAPWSKNFAISITSVNDDINTYSELISSLNIIYVANYYLYRVTLFYDTLPEGYSLEQQSISSVMPGDTVCFNFTRTSCVIRGIVKDTSTQVDMWGNVIGVSNCTIRFVKVDNNGLSKEYVSQTNSKGLYTCYVSPGTYTFQLSLGSNIKNYMEPSDIFSYPITINEGDTIEKNFTLLPKDTVIYIKLKYQGAKSGIRLLFVAQNIPNLSIQTLHMTSQDISLGNKDSLNRREIIFPMYVSKYINQYLVGILLSGGLQGYDSLAPGDTIVGEDLKIVTLGDTVSFEIYNTTTSAISKDKATLPFDISTIKRINNNIFITFTLPLKTNIDFQIFDMRGKEITVIKNKSYEQGIHTISIPSKILPRGAYIIRIKCKNGQIVRKIASVK